MVPVRNSFQPVKKILWRFPGTEVVTQLEDILQLLGLDQLPQASVWVDVEVIHWNIGLNTSTLRPTKPTTAAFCDLCTRTEHPKP